MKDIHDHPDVPRQHFPWVAHVTGVHTSKTWPLQAMAESLGDVTFDRLRIAIASEHTDIPLDPEETSNMDDEPIAATASPPLPIRSWSTSRDTALTYEKQQIGDGRVFKPGALYWDGPGPWPLQYADEMLFCHEGAELAGAILRAGA
ncbi:hypothetical protein ACH4F6_36090 [Streptomyces sp. NPDC017936]|uniref:hypothetical protein n=1 Tax=Streptomyces sp. NPDC017936 TaxID=3365016 RepID=UPI0037999B62